jgi:hypothetical protein
MIKYVDICITQYAINYELKQQKTGYSHILKLVTEREGITVLWNQVVHTDREVLATGRGVGGQPRRT